MAALVALKQILLASIPTFLLVWILYLYVSRVFFQPLQEVLRRRRESTTGLQQAAEANLAQAEQKTAEYQKALRTARAELYRLQEQERQKALDQRAAIVQQARARADEMVGRSKQEIRGDVETAKKGLAAEAEQLAQAITGAILKPSQATAGAPGSGGAS